MEVKALSDDAWLTADSAQVSNYWELYRLVLVTNYRDFVLLGEDSHGNPAKLDQSQGGMYIYNTSVIGLGFSQKSFGL